VPVYERVLGPEHPDTLAIRRNLADWTGRAWEASPRDRTGAVDAPASARDQLAALVPVYERVLGPKHRDTLETRANLAYWTGQAGEVARARDQLAALLPVYERALGPESWDTLELRANLANLVGEMGDAARAREEYAALLPFYERALGPQHPDTQAVSRNLARWTIRSGQ